MVFAGLIVSLGILAITWVIVTLAEFGVTLGTILLLPFMPLMEWIFDKMDKRTDEEILRAANLAVERQRACDRTYEDIKREVYKKYGVNMDE